MPPFRHPAGCPWAAQHRGPQLTAGPGPGLRDWRPMRRGGSGLRPIFSAAPCQAVEECVGHLLGGGVDQARAELGDLAADLGLDCRISAIVLGASPSVSPWRPLREAGDAALPFALIV